MNMTSAQQQQYYSFLERRRREQINNSCLANYNVFVIKDTITRCHINPADVPELSAEFWRLVGEYGEGLFVNELSTLNLTFEEGTLKPIKL